jgi:hypothetical protein
MDAQAGLDPCWWQTHYVGFVMTRLIYCYMLYITTRPWGKLYDMFAKYTLLVLSADMLFTRFLSYFSCLSYQKSDLFSDVFCNVHCWMYKILWKKKSHFLQNIHFPTFDSMLLLEALKLFQRQLIA